MSVIGYGTEELPAFYTGSRLQGGYRIDIRELAKAFYVKQDMGLGGGMLVTNPSRGILMDHEVINKAIDEAVAEANGWASTARRPLPSYWPRSRTSRRRFSGFQHPVGVQQRQTGCQDRGELVALAKN